MLLLKGIVGGIVCVLVAWTLIVAFHFWKVTSPHSGLASVAGGWNYLLQKPLTILLLSTAFGVGMFLTVRLSVRLNP